MCFKCLIYQRKEEPRDFEIMEIQKDKSCCTRKEWLGRGRGTVRVHVLMKI